MSRSLMSAATSAVMQIHFQGRSEFRLKNCRHVMKKFRAIEKSFCSAR